MSGEDLVATALARLEERLGGLVDQLKESNERWTQSHKETIETMTTMIREIKAESERRHADHEDRLRKLEEYRWATPNTIKTSIITAAASITAIVVAFVLKVTT